MCRAAVRTLLPLLCAAAAPRAAAAAGEWAPLRELLRGWQFNDDFAVAVGVVRDGEHRRLFTHEQGKLTMQSRVGTGSTSKWPAAMMLAGAVADGTVESLDSPAHRYVPWWTADPADRRSRVTLRHLLSFTSGFGDGHPGDDARAAAAPRAERRRRARRTFRGAQRVGLNASCIDDAGADPDACARTIYEDIGGPMGVNMTGEPGTVYSYNSFHLQLAAAMVTRASGLTMQQVIEKYLVGPYKMSNTSCKGTNPQLAGCFVTTGDDYANFLAGVLGYTVLPKEIVEASERDYTTFQSQYYTLYGDYGFGHFLSCFDSVEGFTEECRRARVHIDPGAFGFMPMIDRRYNYYIELVAFEASEVSYPRSGIPEYLAQLIKPIADAIIRGDNVSQSAAHSTPAFQRLAMIDVNYIADCYLHPEHCD